MTIEEQEIIDILSDKRYVIVQYDDTDYRERLKFGSLDNLSNDEFITHFKFNTVSERLTWIEASNLLDTNPKERFIAFYKEITQPLLSPL